MPFVQMLINFKLYEELQFDNLVFHKSYSTVVRAFNECKNLLVDFVLVIFYSLLSKLNLTIINE